MKDMNSINMERCSARNKYNEIVESNIKALCKNKENELKDPDKYSKYDVMINGLSISLSQDGICSFSKIRQFSKGDVIKNYVLLRKNMFDCLCWPAYAMSINQMRSAVFKDRMDLLLIDIYEFYEIVSKSTIISEKIVSEIWERCKLARAYIFPYTFYWLKSFGNFKEFISRRRLKPFLEEKDGRPVRWKYSGKGFNQKYFDILIDKTYQHKKEK